MIHKSVRAIYCDDVRAEVSGKLSYMGVYNSEMVVAAFPITLPKLCANVTVLIPYAEPPKKSIHVRIFNDDQLLGEATLDEATLASTFRPSPDTDLPAEDRYLAYAFGFQISPFHIEGPTRVRVRATVDDEECKGNSLKIRLATGDERKILSLD